MSAPMGAAESRKPIAQNRRARHDYEVIGDFGGRGFTFSVSGRLVPGVVQDGDIQFLGARHDRVDGLSVGADGAAAHLAE